MSVASGFSRTDWEDSMKGIILAAGKGSRLNGTAGDKPKCLLRVGGKTLVERQIDALRVSRHRRHRRRRRLPGRSRAPHLRRADVHFVENSRFAQTNSLYSLWLARPLLV